MPSNEDEVMEARLKKAVRRAFKKLSAEIESEPTLVIESDDEANMSAETMSDIRAWLFNRR